MRLSKHTVSNFLEVFAQNAIWALLIAPVGGIVLGLLKARGSLYLVPVLYGLAGCAIILGASAFATYIAASTAQPQHRIAPKRAATALRNLMDRVGMQIQNMGHPDFLMHYVVTLNNGRKISIKQLKQHPYFLYLTLSITYDDIDNTNFAALPGGTTQLLSDVRTHLSLAKIGFDGVVCPFKEITLSKAVPITPTFGELEFLNALGEMDLRLPPRLTQTVKTQLTVR
jgi:hypothetical protein